MEEWKSGRKCKSRKENPCALLTLSLYYVHMILIEIKTDTYEEAQEARAALLTALPNLRLRQPINRPPAFYIIRGWLTRDAPTEEERTPTPHHQTEQQDD